MSSVKCRAKDPSVCAYHGTKSQVSALMNSRIADKMLSRAKDYVKKDFESFDERLEAEYDLRTAQALVDANRFGYSRLSRKLKELRRASSRQDNLFSDEVNALARRKSEAELLEANILANTPALVESYKNFKELTGKLALKSFTRKSINFEESEELVAQLEKVPFGTPVAIETTYGRLYGYTGSATGAPPTRLERILGSRSSLFYERPESHLIKYTYGSLYLTAMGSEPGKDTNKPILLKSVQEIHILESSAYTDGFASVQNSKAAEVSKTPEAVNERYYENPTVADTEGFFGLQGKDYYFEFNGGHRPPNDSTKPNSYLSKDWWLAGDFFFNPVETPVKISKIV